MVSNLISSMADAAKVGDWAGARVGSLVGNWVGARVGRSVGALVGALVGVLVGFTVHCRLLTGVACSDSYWSSVQMVNVAHVRSVVKVGASVWN